MADKRKPRRKKTEAAPDGDLSIHQLEAQRLDKKDADDKSLSEVENFAVDLDEDIEATCIKLYEKINQCYVNSKERESTIDEYWSIYNAIPDENQVYVGNSRCYIPATRDCINARTKRTLKQIFPDNNRHVEAVGPTADPPNAILSLLEHYIRTTKLKSVVRRDLISGDVTGQWNLYVDWTRSYRTVTEIIQQPKIMANEELGPLAKVEIDDSEPEWTEKVKDVIKEGPDVVPFAVQDLAVYPPTVNDIEKASATAIRLRMSKSKVEELVDQGVFVLPSSEKTDVFDKIKDLNKNVKNPAKGRVEDAGIKTNGTLEYALIYEMHCRLPLGEDGRKIPVYVYFAGSNLILGIVKNPRWSGRRPIISAAVDEVEGSFYGISKIEPVKFLQWNLNDFWNMGMDSAQYGLLPVIMTDPLSNPNYQSMVMGLAAVWLADPNKTKPLNFPQLYKDAVGLCGAIKAQIWESMDVNEGMMGKIPAGRKNAQAMAAMAAQQESAIDDHAKRYEDVILNPLLEYFVEDDRQFREEELTVISLGDAGRRATVEAIEPQQFESKYFFRWVGTSFVMGMQRMQQQIATMNVLRGIPPQLYPGRRLDISPILESLVGNVYGPELAQRILVDERNMYEVPPSLENEMMNNNIPAEVHAADNDVQHMMEHAQAAEATGDHNGLFKAHILAHMQQRQAKMQSQMGAGMQKQPGYPGIPGGSAPGVPGTPRPGAVPAAGRPMQQPNGAVHADQMQDQSAVPRG